MTELGEPQAMCVRACNPARTCMRTCICAWTSVHAYVSLDINHDKKTLEDAATRGW